MRSATTPVREEPTSGFVLGIDVGGIVGARDEWPPAGPDALEAMSR